jgi:hypothetical protein
MTLTISLDSDLEKRLTEEASRRGVDAAEYARRLLEEHLPATEGASDQATLDLFARWEAEDATDDPAELLRREAEWEQLKRALNESHSSNRRLFP